MYHLNPSWNGGSGGLSRNHGPPANTSPALLPPGEQPNRRKNDEPASEDQGPPTKRRRAALACNSCRTRKSRCDGMRPSCTMCKDMGFECRYQPSPAYSNVIVGKEYLSSIEDRMKMVEDRLFSLTNLVTCKYLTGPEISDPPRTVDVGKRKTQQISADSGFEAACLAEEIEHNGDPEDSIDGMCAVSFELENDCAFFGPSSNIALLREISRAVARIGNTDKPWTPLPVADRPLAYIAKSAPTPAAPSPSSLRYSFSDPYKPDAALINANQKVNLFALPPEPLAEELIHRYFANTGQVFPFIHEKEFIEKYNQSRSGASKGVRRMWLGLLNMVFATATNVSLSPDCEVSSAMQRTTESNIYYQRGSGLCSEQIALGRGLNLDTVHFLLLMAQYLQSTQKSVQAGITHGLAVKVSMQLGLHSSEASKGFSPLEREIRKRTWYACIITDRTFSMTFGRPLTIHDTYVKLELPVPYSSVVSGSGQDRLDEMSVAFFNSTITLYRIMSSVIDLLYGQNLGCAISVNAVDTVVRILKLESDLLEWQQSCTPSLITFDELHQAIARAENHTLASQSENGDEKIPPAWWPVYELRLQTVITLRHNNVRILLHRPVLVALLSRVENRETDLNELSIIQQVGSSSLQKCSRSAKEIISIVSTLVRSKGFARGLLGAWWFSLYYTFNAALVIISDVLISIRRKEESQDAAHAIAYSEDAGSYLRDAIGALQNLDSDNRMVARCRGYLVQLVQVLESLLENKARLLGIDSQLQSACDDFPGRSGEEGHLAKRNTLPLLSHSDIIQQKQSPLGIDFGEFLGDLDTVFLNDHMFAFGQEVSNSLNHNSES